MGQEGKLGLNCELDLEANETFFWGRDCIPCLHFGARQGDFHPIFPNNFQLKSHFNPILLQPLAPDIFQLKSHHPVLVHKPDTKRG